MNPPLLFIPMGPPPQQQQRLCVDVHTAMRVRNMSGGSTGSLESDLSRSWGSSTSSSSSSSAGCESVGTSLNSPQVSSGQESVAGGNLSSQTSKNVVNPGRYKTEMCRPFNETGHCKYGDKCQFAHGSRDIRGLPRHPKYKTELCRTFHTVGFCPYGPRCHFIHSEDEGKLVEINAMKQQQAAQQAAREMAQLQAQQHLLTSQFTALVSQVHLGNHLVSPPPPLAPVYSQFPPSLPSTSHYLTSQAGLPISLPNHQQLLGSTTDSPPDSPIGSFPDNEVFHPNQLPTAAPIRPKVDGLGAALCGMVLEPTQQPDTTFTAISSTSEHMQPLSPPSSPDSLCSSLDSQRSSRLPVFSKLAVEN